MDLEFLIKLNWYLESAWILRSVYISERKSTCLKKNLYNMEFVLNAPS